MFRYRCGVSGTDVVWPGSRAGLHQAQLPFVQHIDGRRSIREIIECVLAQHGLPDAGMRRAARASSESCSRRCGVSTSSRWRCPPALRTVELPQHPVRLERYVLSDSRFHKLIADPRHIGTAQKGSSR